MSDEIKPNNSGHGYKISSSIEAVTPSMAKEWLDSQGQNRRVKPAHVQRFSRDMANGHWIISGSLKFDNTGVLMDGQHRLAALIKSKTTQEFLILRGFLPDAKKALDIGLSRTASNVGQIYGKDITDTDAATINHLYLPGNREKMTVATMLDIFDIYKPGIKFPRNTQCDHLIRLNATIRSLITKAYYYENHQRLQEFCQVFCTGFLGTSGMGDSAAIALRENIRRKKEARDYQTNSNARLDSYLIAQNCLEKFIAKAPLTQLKKVSKLEDKYPLPHIQGNWEEYKNRYRNISTATLNPDIITKIDELKEAYRVEKMK